MTDEVVRVRSDSVDEAAVRRAVERIWDSQCCLHTAHPPLGKKRLAEIISTELASDSGKVEKMKLCTVCGNPFQYPPSDNKADATTCAWCAAVPNPDKNEGQSIPLTDRAEQNTLGEMQKNAAPANVERPLLPTQESGLATEHVLNSTAEYVKGVIRQTPIMQEVISESTTKLLCDLLTQFDAQLKATLPEHVDYIMAVARYSDASKEQQDIARPLPVQIVPLIETIADFDDWVWCECSECRADGRSHAVNTNASLAKLADEVRALISQHSPKVKIK